MKVKCIFNRVADLSKDMFLPEDMVKISTSIGLSQYPLEIGKEYTVYAMTIREEAVWYYVCDKDFTYYPIWRPCVFFEMIDGDFLIIGFFHIIKVFTISDRMLFGPF